nr:MAG: hypothetical protein [Microvirus sp.]
MAKPIFKNRYTNPPEFHSEVNSGQKLTETAGYISREKRITELIQAGQRLDNYRQAHYDSDEVEGEPNIDPTRKPGYDRAEGTETLHAVKEMLKKAKEAPTASTLAPVVPPLVKDPSTAPSVPLEPR